MEKYTAPGVEQGDFGAFGILKLTMGSSLFVLSVPTIVALATFRTIAKGFNHDQGTLDERLAVCLHYSLRSDCLGDSIFRCPTPTHSVRLFSLPGCIMFA